MIRFKIKKFAKSISNVRFWFVPEKLYLETDGSGLWSEKKKRVGIYLIMFNTINPYEMKVYFDSRDWNTKTDGLIYTDNLFETQLKNAARYIPDMQDFDFSYSEQGMQGFDYVSFDIWKKKTDKTLND